MLGAPASAGALFRPLDPARPDTVDKPALAGLTLLVLSRVRLRHLALAAGLAALPLCWFFLDRPLARAVERIPTGWNPLFHGLGLLSGFPFVLGVSLVMAALFFVRVYGRGLPRGPLIPLLYIPAAALTASAVTGLLKVVFARYRPGVFIDAGLYGFSYWKAGYWSNSFPSGHAAVAFALAFALGASYPRWRGPALALAALIAASRVLLNLHYLSDVIAGVLLGIGLALLYRRLFAYFRFPVRYDGGP